MELKERVNKIRDFIMWEIGIFPAEIVLGKKTLKVKFYRDDVERKGVDEQQLEEDVNESLGKLVGRKIYVEII